MAEFATLVQLKSHLNKTSTADDGELGLMLDAAEDIVRSLVGSYSTGTVTETLPVTGGTVLLSGRPVGPVTVNGGAVTNFVTSAAAGVLYGLHAGWGNDPATCWVTEPFAHPYRTVTVSYSTGGGDVPAAVTLACLIIAGHLWETQRGTSPSPLAVQDPSVPGFGTAGFAIPNRAKELLQPFIRESAQIA